MLLNLKKCKSVLYFDLPDKLFMLIPRIMHTLKRSEYITVYSFEDVEKKKPIDIIGKYATSLVSCFESNDIDARNKAICVSCKVLWGLMGKTNLSNINSKSTNNVLYMSNDTLQLFCEYLNLAKGVHVDEYSIHEKGGWNPVINMCTKKDKKIVDFIHRLKQNHKGNLFEITHFLGIMKILPNFQELIAWYLAVLIKHASHTELHNIFTL